MFFLSWLRKPKPLSTHNRREPIRYRPTIEPLEDRLAPATPLSLFHPDADGSQTGGEFGDRTATDSGLVVVGMPYADTGGLVNCGAAFVYSATTGAWIATLADPTPASGDYFGKSVAVSGNTVVVGAWGDDTAPSGSGLAYVFNATTGARIATLANPLTNHSPTGSGVFGYSVSVSGNTVVVGDDTGSGQAFVFNATTGALIATLANPTPASGGNFGRSVAVSGNTAVVSAPWYDEGATTASGRAYVFNATTGGLITTLVNPSPANGLFGMWVSVSGNTAVVGYGTNSGQVYVFNATTGKPIALLTPPPASNGNFGVSVSVSGNTVVVGASGALGSGRAYVFNATTGEPIVTLAKLSPASGDRFGQSVSVSGNTVVVGASGDDTQYVDQGAAYVFSLDSGTVGLPIVTSVAPFVGPTAGGITVVINGANFLGVTGAAGVKFGANNATSYTVDSETRITAVLPAGNGLVDVIVTNAGLTLPAAGTADDFQYTSAAAPVRFVLSGPASVGANTAFSITVTALDAFGNITTGYTGTIHFTDSRTGSALPANYKFTAADNGVHTFTGIKLKQKGQHTITVVDTLTNTIVGTWSINVT